MSLQIEISRATAKRNRQRRCHATEKGKEKAKRNRLSEAGREARRRFNKTERYKAIKRRYHDTEKGRAALMRNTTKRRAKKLNALPDSDSAAIDAIYAESIARRAKGEDVEVDHRIPLSRGGLHIANNLRIVPSAFNRRKRNLLDEELAA